MIRHAEEVMGTVVSFVLRGDEPGDEAAHEALRKACATLHHADAIFSTYRPDSPISCLRRGEITVEDAPRDVAEVLELCRLARRLSGGWFDPWAMPGGLDPTGLVKGWAAARALDDVRAAGVPAAMVNAAGDVAAYGSPEAGRPWRIGVSDPLRRGAVAWTTEIAGAIATSGVCERRSHILDPYTGRTPTALLSATVTGPDLALADALATAVVAGGEEALEHIADLDGYAALCLDDHGLWSATERFAAEPLAG